MASIHSVRLTLFALLSIALAAVGALIYLFNMPDVSYHGPLPPLSEEGRHLRDHLRRHVTTLAGTIGGRSVSRYSGLQASATYLKDQLAAQGFRVGEQVFTVQGQEVRNIEVERQGTNKPDEIVVIGAHYDTTGNLPGANDNATGTAAVLEIARYFRDKAADRSLRLVLFVNEEPPYFQTDAMGSLVYARRCRERKENIVAMLSLETLGYYSDEPSSQQYPAGLQAGLPDAANFIGFVSNVSSAQLLRRVVRHFRSTTRFPAEGAAAPDHIPGVGWSDHWSFWQQGYPAVMVTDTAPYRYPYYHTAEDTPDKIDYDRLARVVRGLQHVAENLVSVLAQ